MVDNTGFISTLGVTPTAQIDDATDAIHSSIIMSLNAATGENRPIEGFNIVQATSSSHTSYAVTAGDVLRNGLRVDVSAATLTTDSSTGTSNSVDWYGLIVVNSSNALAWRHGTSSPTSTGKLDTSNAMQYGNDMMSFSETEADRLLWMRNPGSKDTENVYAR